LLHLILIHEVRGRYGYEDLGLRATERAKRRAWLLGYNDGLIQAQRVEGMSAWQRFRLNLCKEHGTHDAPTPCHTQPSFTHALDAFTNKPSNETHVSTLSVCQIILIRCSTIHDLFNESVRTSVMQKRHV
jgi:hypothetical protein